MTKQTRREPPWAMFSFLLNVIRLLLVWLWPHD